MQQHSLILAMSKSMRKIIYYENVLEFKKNNKEKLSLNEINGWQLCRTCLEDTCEDDANMEKMNVIDVMQGTFLNIKEMLVEITNIKITTTGNLPFQLCKECISKITTLYYFTIQVRKADCVLKKLANKIKIGQCGLVQACETQPSTYERQTPVEEKMIEVEEEVFEYPEDLISLEDITNTSKCQNEAPNIEFEDLSDVKCCSDSFESITEIEALLKSSENDASVSEAEKAILLETESHVSLKSDRDHENLRIYFADQENDLFEESETSENGNEEIIITKTASNYKVQHKMERTRKRSTTTTQTSGYRHKQPRVTSPLLNDFNCALCQDSFGRQQDLVHHVRKVHPNSKAYKCRVCGNLFSHIQSLSRHMNSHKEAVILNECEYCTKSFVRVDDLKRHLRIHTGERPHTCSMCERSFQQHCDLKYHEEKHLCVDPNYQPRQFTCVQCDLPYLSRTGLYLHKKKHHRRSSDCNKLSYHCSSCEKSFQLQNELRRHEKKHLQSEIIKCIDGEEDFTYRDFYMHQKTQHKTENPLQNECKIGNEEDFTAIVDGE